MSAIDTIKEISRATSTAGLSKDVIDLLEKKIALLTEQVTTLESENKDLKAKLYELEKELQAIKPKGDLADDTVKVLKLLFEHDGLTDSQIASALSMSRGMAEYHTGALRQKKMVGYPMIRTLGRETPNCMLQGGREYLVKHGHAS